LWFFRRQHLAVLLGTIISTTVLTGALIVGDSVRNSLDSLVNLRLGSVEYALQSGDRFFRDILANDLAEKIDAPSASLLMVDGIAIDPGTSSRLNSVQVLGIDSYFWAFTNHEISIPDRNQAIISQNVADALEIKEGSDFLLRVENADIIPVNSPFTAEDNPTIALRLKVAGIADNAHFGRFSLKSNQAAPFNVFLDRNWLAEKLELEGLANVILVGESENQSLSVDLLNHKLKETIILEDFGIHIRELTRKGVHEVYSDRIFMDKPVVEAVFALNQPNQPILTYLVNSISYNRNQTPYSFITAAPPGAFKAELANNEIFINEWLANDLDVGTGDTLKVDYFKVGPMRRLEEKSSRFVVRKIISTGKSFADSTLMPRYPGLADAGSCSDWNTSIPIDLDRIRDKDESYWDDYKGTPKGLISLNTGINIWGNLFGDYTAIRFDASDISKERLGNKILQNLDPKDVNILFYPVKQEGSQAAINSVDFGELFLSLSFFVIVAGVLLTVLVYTLGAESRMEEVGVLAALGFRRQQIIRMRIRESIYIVLLGAVLGVIVGILYNFGLMAGLNSVWKDAVRTSMLDVYIKPGTLIIGALSGIVISLISIWFVIRKKLKDPVVGLIKDKAQSVSSLPGRKRKINMLIGLIGFIGAIVMVVWSVMDSIDKNAGLFLAAGALVMVGCIGFLNNYLSFSGKNKDTNNLSLSRLALKNAGRNRWRSLSIIILLALGVFTIIITGANRKTFYGTENNRQSGTGGYLFWGETTMPVLYDLNTTEGKEKLGLEEEEWTGNVDFVQFQTLDGNDASCLNLNQVQRPKILGVDPYEFDKKKAFSFAKLLNREDKEHPWLSLVKQTEPNVIPAFADQTVLTWGLMKKVGDTLVYLDESGEKIYLQLIGGLESSVFQGNILIAQSFFTKHFPSTGGAKIMLIDAPLENQDEIKESLQYSFTDFGLQLSKASDRLAEFNSVTNTYLTVFMILGGLGVIIGTIGLGIVLLRNLLERRKEVALLLALGYEKQKIFSLIFLENLMLLLAGIIVGLFAAIIGILPSILSPSYTIPGFFMLIIILIIFLSGILWIYFPLKSYMGKMTIGVLKND